MTKFSRALTTWRLAPATINARMRVSEDPTNVQHTYSHTTTHAEHQHVCQYTGNSPCTYRGGKFQQFIKQTNGITPFEPRKGSTEADPRRVAPPLLWWIFVDDRRTPPPPTPPPPGVVKTPLDAEEPPNSSFNVLAVLGSAACAFLFGCVPNKEREQNEIVFTNAVWRASPLSRDAPVFHWSQVMITTCMYPEPLVFCIR